MYLLIFVGLDPAKLFLQLKINSNFFMTSKKELINIGFDQRCNYISQTKKKSKMSANSPTCLSLINNVRSELKHWGEMMPITPHQTYFTAYFRTKS